MTPYIESFLKAVTIFFAAFAAAMLLARPLISLSWRLNIIDVPGSSAHKKHKRPTPRTGGIILAAVLAILWIFFGRSFSTQVNGVLGAAIIVFIFGVVDDIKGMNARGKLAGQIAATALLIYFGVKVSILKMPGTTVDDFLNILITLVWVVGISNAMNLVDSADGLAISLTLITSSFFLAGAIIAGQEQLVYQAVALLGVGIVLLYFNLPPANLFLGDSGTQTIGFLLASFAILYNPATQPQASSWFVPITFLAVPIFDVCLVFFSRIRRGKPFYKSDTNHTYHRLIRRGLPASRAVWLMDMAAGVIGLIGLFALYQSPTLANSIFAGLLILGLAVFTVLDAGTL